MTNGEIMDDLWNDFVETESLETEIKNGGLVQFSKKIK